MTDEPTKGTPQLPTPPTPPSEPSDVGFAAIEPPGQPAPQMPPSAYPPSPKPNNRAGGGPSVILIGGVALLLVLVIGAGGMFALNLGPFARPTPTRVAQPTPTIPPVTPSPRPSATASAGQTATPVASATASTGPTATPIPSGDVIAVLLSHVPNEIVGSCTTTTGAGKVLARAKCSARDDKIRVTYFLYADFDSMFATYEGFRETSQIEQNSGNCNDAQTWPAESDFAISGEASGRFLCTEALGSTTIYWTDNRLNILSQATDVESDDARLVDFWIHDSGPDL